MSARVDKTVELPAVLMPDESRVSFHGSVSIGKMTITVNKAPRHRADDPLFIGVCSTPLVQFYRHKDMITLMRGSSYLFDNAALSAGIAPRNDAIDNPSSWETLTVKFDSLVSCDTAVDALLAKQAEEVFAPPFPMREMPTPSSVRPSSRASSRHGGDDAHRSHSSRRESAAESVDSYNRHNQFRSARSITEDNASQNSRNSPSSHHRHHRSGSISHNGRPASSHISERPERRESTVRSESTRGPTPQEADVASVTTRSSRLPSRRENDDATSTRSSRLPSRRENDETASSALYTATESIRSSQRIPSRRAAEMEATPSGRNAVTPSNVDTASNGRHGSTTKRRERRPVDPIEREFRAEEKPRARTGSSRRHRTPTAASAAADATPASSASRRSRSTGRRPRTASTPAEDTYMAYSNSVSPRSTVMSSRQRSEQDQFFRMLQKMQHHRLHFMTYLHKEMVHQAYLAEEAKVKAAAGGANGKPRSGSSHRGNSVNRRTASIAADSPRSARTPVHARDRSNLAAEESSRLQEIEARMSGVEALHREAEREREAAARLRREYEWKLDELLAGRGAGAAPHGVVNSRDASEFNSFAQSPNRRSSNYSGGQMVVVPEHGSRAGGAVYPHMGAGAGQLMPYGGAPPLEEDIGIAIVDRYIYGDEWYRLYPSQEVDVRFNAQIDVCLALKLPRERVTITNLVVDQPGLRVTAEISHDHNKLPRDMVERRIHGSPFRFLQRMYDMRDLFDPQNASAGALPSNAAGGSTHAIRSGGSNTTRRGSLVVSGAGRPSQSRRPSIGASRRPSRHHPHDRSSEGGYSDVESRLSELTERQERRARDAKEKLRQRKRRLADEVRRQIREQLEQLAEAEEDSRRRIQLAEVTTRQRTTQELRGGPASSPADVEQAEAVARATIAVGAARQWQVLSAAHRRQQHAVAVLENEKDRRAAIADQEAYARRALDVTMNPRQKPSHSGSGGSSSRKDRLAQYNAALAQEAIHDLEADERAARAALMTDAMTEWLDILYNAPSGRDGQRAPSVAGPTSLRQLLAEVAADEADRRRQLQEEEARHRTLYGTERIIQAEAIARDEIESEELAQRGAILDDMLQENRAALERRVSDREAIATLVNEEQFYRSTILADEQDEFEVIAEMFAEGLKDLLARMAEEEPEDDFLTPRRRQTSTRQAKPFHYMTFSPEDMDYAPSAVLAIEGILGCGINKNLEVTSISRPLPRTESEELQFQAGDMILDVAGHSLHSLSHLREVLSSRTMQIQEEANAEFPDVPRERVTTDPALQRYIEVLCEHHNFLVQVLRGCDIFQIIVRS